MHALRHSVLLLELKTVKKLLLALQIGETDIDHWHVFRAEKDDFTPRTEFVTLPPMTPGSDLLYQVPTLNSLAHLFYILCDNCVLRKP